MQLRGCFPDSRSGLKMGDFIIRKFSPQIALEPRDAVPLSRLCFSREKLSCHNHSGRVLRFRVQSSLGCDGEKTGSLSSIPERFSGKFGPVVLDSILGLILGDIFSKKDRGVVVTEGACAADPSL